MTVPRPHDRPISTHAAADEGMETFTVRLPRWPIFGLFRRNPLLRASDRLEALVLVLAVMVSLLAVPVAAAVGTAIHDSRRDVYAQQLHNRHLVTATITDDAAAQNISQTNTATMAARWSAAGTEHTGAVTAQSATEPGPRRGLGRQQRRTDRRTDPDHPRRGGCGDGRALHVGRRHSCCYGAPVRRYPGGM
jgi:hypothetical protein